MVYGPCIASRMCPRKGLVVRQTCALGGWYCSLELVLGGHQPPGKAKGGSVIPNTRDLEDVSKITNRSDRSIGASKLELTSRVSVVMVEGPVSALARSQWRCTFCSNALRLGELVSGVDATLVLLRIPLQTRIDINHLSGRTSSAYRVRTP